MAEFIKKTCLYLVFYAAIMLGVALLSLFLGSLVYLIWNYLMPDLFGVKKISLEQAILLYFLCHLLFSSGAITNKVKEKTKEECQRDKLKLEIALLEYHLLQLRKNK